MSNVNTRANRRIVSSPVIGLSEMRGERGRGPRLTGNGAQGPRVSALHLCFAKVGP